MRSVSYINDKDILSNRSRKICAFLLVQTNLPVLSQPSQILLTLLFDYSKLRLRQFCIKCRLNSHVSEIRIRGAAAYI